METLDRRSARRLALARAGLLKPEWTGLPRSARGAGPHSRAAAYAIIRRFGYLQLDTIPVAGARSHALVLLSRLPGLHPRVPEELLRPGEPIFEYWGHEASWIPLELYPAFCFRREAFVRHPWYGDVLEEHPEMGEEILQRIREQGPLRIGDFDDRGEVEFWGMTVTKKILSALWSCGELVVSERRNFHRTWDLAERVIPGELRRAKVPLSEGLRTLLLQALRGHGWATTGTLCSTWRLRNLRAEVARALAELVEAGEILPCALCAEGRSVRGWVRPRDLELAARLRTLRPRRDRGILLSPFDPVLWDRRRVRMLFGFDQVLEIFKPAHQRVYGYYCLPVLAGDRLVARYDLKADRRAGRLDVVSLHLEEADVASAAASVAASSALERHGRAVGLEPRGRWQAGKA